MSKRNQLRKRERRNQWIRDHTWYRVVKTWISRPPLLWDKEIYDPLAPKEPHKWEDFEPI